MMRTAAFLQCIVLTVGGLPGFPQPGCLWDDLLDEESVSRVELRGRRSVSLSMFFIYVNPPELGACILGDDLYRTVSDDVLADEPNRHVFWVGVGGAFVDLFRAQRIYMIQGDRRFDVVSTRTTKGAISNPTILVEILITLEGEIDFSEPVTIFYRSGMGTYSNEYWLPDKYLKDTARRDFTKQLHANVDGDVLAGQKHHDNRGSM